MTGTEPVIRSGRGPRATVLALVASLAGLTSGRRSQDAQAPSRFSDTSHESRRLPPTA